MIRPCLLIALAVLATGPVAAEETSTFTTGPLIDGFGAKAVVPDAQDIPTGTRFQVAFDISVAGPETGINPRIASSARFLNMHSAAGIDPDALSVALVLHGTAIHDLANDAAYGRAHGGKPNPNKALIADLLKHGVTVTACGQSLAARGIEAGELLPGVEIALSAMTKHALLQQDGFTLNPF